MNDLPSPSEEAPPIGDYGLIGDCASAALVSRAGSIDWLCWPRFDSEPVFGRLLDWREGWCFSVRPVEHHAVRRRYLPGANVLETTFQAPGGTLRLVDAMVVAGGRREDRGWWPDHELLRVLECTEGEVEVEIRIDPRQDWGRRRPRRSRRGPHGVFFDFHGQVMIVRSEVDLADGDDVALRGRARLRSGERVRIATGFDLHEPAVLPLVGEHADARLEETVEYWRGWSGRCRYEGRYRDQVVRSALVLKLLTYARSGSVVAAPTTSLPETPGGDRNWDYRFCWIRDATMTLRGLFDLGYEREGRAFLSWLLSAIGGSQPDLQVLYDVFGATHLHEVEIDHLAGYRGARPVRAGNAASDQLQLDIHGEIVGAVFEFLRRDGSITSAQARLLRKIGDVVCERWREPDAGIWEKRSGRSHHTHSKAMCWVALDRLIELHDKGHVEADVERYRAERDRIREDIEQNGFDEALGSYVSVYGTQRLDAALLLLAVTGYVEADDERMRGTLEAVRAALGRGPLLLRYPPDEDDGMEGREGAFGIASFWPVEVLARAGRRREAAALFEAICAHANDLGLFAEEIDPDSGAALGNFPQAFTHVGLVNAALTLEGDEERSGGEVEPEAGDREAVGELRGERRER